MTKKEHGTLAKSVFFAYSHGFITEGSAMKALYLFDRLSFRDRWIQFLKDNPEVAKATGHDNYLD